jgi:hypothetical protein
MNPPPFWNLWARYRLWSRENRAQAQIAGIAALAIGLIVLMFIVTIVIVVRTLL